MICNLFVSLLWRWENKPFTQYERYNFNLTDKKFDDFYNLNISWDMIKNNLSISIYFILLIVPINFLPRYISIIFVIIGKLIFLIKVNSVLSIKYFHKLFFKEAN